MAWLYALIVAAVMAGAVYAVEAYNHAISDAKVSKTEAKAATERAERAEQIARDRQELFDKSEEAGRQRYFEAKALREKVGAKDEQIEALKKTNPAVLACESCAVDPLIRRLRRDSFGEDGTARAVLRPDSGAESDRSASAAGRDIRADKARSGPTAPSADRVQSDEAGRAASSDAAKPATVDSWRDKVKALFRKG